MNNNIFVSLWNFLSGKKTYIVAALTVILGLLNGDTQMVLTGLGLFSLRNAIPTSTPTASTQQ